MLSQSRCPASVFPCLVQRQTCHLARNWNAFFLRISLQWSLFPGCLLLVSLLSIFSCCWYGPLPEYLGVFRKLNLTFSRVVMLETSSAVPWHSVFGGLVLHYISSVSFVVDEERNDTCNRCSVVLLNKMPKIWLSVNVGGGSWQHSWFLPPSHMAAFIYYMLFGAKQVINVRDEGDVVTMTHSLDLASMPVMSWVETQDPNSTELWPKPESDNRFVKKCVF